MNLAHVNKTRNNSKTHSIGIFKYRKLVRICAFSIFFVVTSSILLEHASAATIPDMRLYRYGSYRSYDSASQLTRYFDMMQGGTGAVLSQVNAIRPDQKVLYYKNARAVYTYNTAEVEYFKTQKWILKDAYGKYVYSKKYPSIMMVDVGNSAYQSYLANKINSILTQKGFEGVMLDQGIAVNTYLFVDPSGTPINPRTGKPWTNIEVKNAMISMLQKIKAAIGSKLLVANGIWTGRSFYTTDQYSSYVELLQKTNLDCVMSEGIWNTYNYQWLTVSDWKKSLDFVIWMENNFLGGTSRAFLPIVNSVRLPSGTTHLQVAAYGFASTLLAITPSDKHVYFGLGNLDIMANYGQALFDQANSLGNPVGNYYVSNGVYIRAFDHGKVYVNPTGTQLSVEGRTIKAHTGNIVTSGTTPVTTTVDTEPPTVTSVSVYPTSFNPKIGQTTAIKYSVSESCYSTVQVYNSAGTLVRTLLNNVLHLYTGAKSIIWNGKNSSGTIVPTGTYTIKISIIDKAGNKATPYPIIKTVTVT